MATLVKQNIENSAKLTLREFLQQTCLHGYRYFVEPNRPKIERIMWYVTTTICALLAILICTFTWNRFHKNPTVTSLQSQRYPIYKVPFPGIAVCSANKISKAMAKQYASELSKRDRNVSETWIYEKIHHLGKLYEHRTIDLNDDYQEFQDFLDRVDLTQDTGTYNTFDRMFMLAPKCNDIIVKCKWAGHFMDCSKNFTLRSSRDGFCCTFNYFRQNRVFNLTKFTKPIRSSSIGSDRGLVILLNTSVDNYYYSIKNTIGFSINIFNPFDYPDALNGYLTQIIVNRKIEAFLELEAITTKADRSIQYYDPKQRGCLFYDEHYGEYNGHYSQSECILKCRIKAIKKLCNCVPFYMPINYPDTKTFRRCILTDIPCILKYRRKILIVKPIIHENNDEFDKLYESSISCPDCWPLCSISMYKVQSNFFTLKSRNLSISSEILYGYTDLSNFSVVRIYFPFASSFLYRTNVVFTWYEIIGNFGGVLGLCIGFSAIAVMEIIYFLTIKFYQNLQLNKTNNSTLMIAKESNNKFPPLTYQQVEMIMVEEYMKNRGDKIKI